ncbi:MAG TPA: hypothetical protein VND65_06890, partial [Candidatus Binatia bacterium]|nr:hypothetical protein [Candidatus Binatia bacterium]
MRLSSAEKCAKIKSDFKFRKNTPIPIHYLCFLGYGNVNRTLVRLLHERETELRDRHGIIFRITGIASRRLGWLADPQGLAFDDAPASHPGHRSTNVREWLAAAR